MCLPVDGYMPPQSSYMRAFSNLNVNRLASVPKSSHVEQHLQ
jgi:hypothetical protein